MGAEAKGGGGLPKIDFSTILGYFLLFVLVVVIFRWFEKVGCERGWWNCPPAVSGYGAGMDPPTYNGGTVGALPPPGRSQRGPVWIPQPQPSESAYRCVHNGVPGWCD